MVLTSPPHKKFLVTKSQKRRSRFFKNCRAEEEEEEEEEEEWMVYQPFTELRCFGTLAFCRFIFYNAYFLVGISLIP
jgi:hypothetical protein